MPLENSSFGSDSTSPLKTPEGSAKKGSFPSAAPQEQKPRGASEFVNRAVFSLIMAYTFLGLISQGIVLVLPVVLLIECMMFYEIMRITVKERKEKQTPKLFTAMPWFFLSITVVIVTAFNLRDPLLDTFPEMRSFYHSFGLIGFSLCMLGFVFFVLSLRKGMYRYQIGVFAWMAMTLIFIVVQGSFQTANMVRGMCWFLLPISCVVHNDIWAYACGKSFGRTPLLRLSPKKTLEGFIGAWIMTTVWAYWFTGFLTHFPQLICPKTVFGQPIVCEKDPIFVFRDIEVYPLITTATFGFVKTIHAAPIQFHGIVFAAFASLLAPFGGFFASGLKRAFKLKDFGTLIPGHGGMTDRMDCQIIMGMFTYVYLESFIFPRQRCPTAGGIASCVQSLPDDIQRQLATEILARLGGKTQ